MGKWLDKTGLTQIKGLLATKFSTKVDKYPGAGAGKYLQTDNNGNAFWGDPVSVNDIRDATEDWLEANMSNIDSTVALDTSLTTPGAAADAKSTGDLITVSDTTPTSGPNKLWIKRTPESEVTVPTYDEFTDLKSALNEEIDSGYVDQIPVIIERGKISGGSPESSNYYVRSDFFTSDNVIYFRSIKLLGTAYIFEYLSDGTYNNIYYGMDYTSGSILVENPSGKKYRFSYTHNPQYSISADGINECYSDFILCSKKSDVVKLIESSKSDVESQISKEKTYNDNMFYKDSITTTEFVQGARNAATPDVISANNNRCTTKEYFNLKAGDVITIDSVSSGYKAAIVGRTTFGTSYDSGWKTSKFSYIAPSDMVAFVTVATSAGNTQLSPSDFSCSVTVQDRASRMAKNKKSDILTGLASSAAVDSGYINPIHVEIERGKINTSTGNNSNPDSAYYIRSSGYFTSDDIIYFKPIVGMATLTILEYSSAEVYSGIYYTPKYNDGVLINNPSGKKYRLSYTHSPQYSITVDNVYDCYNDFVIFTKKSNLLSAVESSGGSTILDENTWGSYLDGKTADVQEMISTIGQNGMVFAFATDCHIPRNNLYTPHIMKRMETNFSVFAHLNGGDYLDEDTEEGGDTLALSRLWEWRRAMKGIIEYAVRGNHDNNNVDGNNTEYAITNSQLYGVMFAQVEEKVNTNGKLYYVIDNASQKIRIIMLDISYFATDEMHTWMKQKMTELDSTWTILIVEHYIWTQNADTNPGTIGQATIDAVNAIYSELSAKFIGILAGHTHQERNEKESVNGYNLIARNWNPGNRGTGTDSVCFDYVGIDKSENNEKLIFINIGSGNDLTVGY